MVEDEEVRIETPQKSAGILRRGPTSQSFVQTYSNVGGRKIDTLSGVACGFEIVIHLCFNLAEDIVDHTV